LCCQLAFVVVVVVVVVVFAVFFFFFLARILDSFDFDFCDFLVYGFGICVCDGFFSFFFPPHLHFVCFLAVEWKESGLLTICFLERGGRDGAPAAAVEE
jgi:hypothetical protein